jgi:hypothetical protein
VSLGSGFPPGFRRNQILRRLRPGAVIKLARRMDDGRIHEKRFVVLVVDDYTVTCVINSEISPFIKHRADMLRCQVTMPLGDHAFMDHDSHVDCSRTRTYATVEVVRDLMDRPECILGVISPDLREAIVGALKFAPTLPPAEVEEICAALENPPGD